MNTHPYLRAYMAGVVLPSLFLLVALTVFILARLVFRTPIPIERVIIFPMAVVPNAFGIWNMFYLWLRPHRHLRGTMIDAYSVPRRPHLSIRGFERTANSSSAASQVWRN